MFCARQQTQHILEEQVPNVDNSIHLNIQTMLLNHDNHHSPTPPSPQLLIFYAQDMGTILKISK
jgi:hypothetical protein